MIASTKRPAKNQLPVPSRLEAIIALQIKVLRIRPAETEFKFHPTRSWRFDFAWPELMIALEVEGGTRSGGRHTRHAGFERDCEKYNTAGLYGWTVLRATADMVKDGRAIDFVVKAIAAAFERREQARKAPLNLELKR